MPQGSNIDRDTLRGALTGKHLPGRVVFPETTSAGGGAGRIIGSAHGLEGNAYRVERSRGRGQAVRGSTS